MPMKDTAQQCKAIAKSTGERCKNPAVKGYNVCRMHGAGSPKKGRAGGRPIEHGLYSKYLPSDILPRYEEGRDDPRVVEVKESMFVLYAHITEVIERLDTGESATAWAETGAAYRMIVDAMNESDPLKLRDGVQLLGAAVDAGARAFDYARENWSEIRGLMDDHRKLAESQRRIEEAMQQTITLKELRVVVALIGDIVRRHVSDSRTMSAIEAELRGVLAGPAPSPN